MARKIRNSELETRSRRLKLPISKRPVFVKIGTGLNLGYRRNQAAGTWVVAIADGQGGRSVVAIGKADDYDDADGAEFLDFWQAQERAKARARNGIVKGVEGESRGPLTVKRAVDVYLEWLKAKNEGTAADTRGRLEKHFLPKFAGKVVAALTKTGLDSWLASMVRKSDDPEDVRRSKDSANRVLSMVKAALNHAMQDPKNGLTDDSAWRLVKPFQQVAKPRDIRFTDEEARRLIASAPDKATADLITGAFLTGARYGELAGARVSSLDVKAMTLRVGGKTGARTVILQKSAADFLTKLATDRGPEEFLFEREEGKRWKRSEQTRPLKAALEAAGLPEDGCIYALRHTYISRAIEGGVPLTVIASNAGTSVRMIEKTYAKVLAEKQRAFIEAGAPTL